MSMQIAVVICSVGRPDSLAAVLPWLDRQTKPPSEIILVVTRPDDLPDVSALDLSVPIKTIFSEKGLPRQRNCGLKSVLGQCDAVFFIDDDYVPAPDALCGIQQAFAAFPTVSGLTGNLLADGIHTGGLSFQQAGELIARYQNDQSRPTEPGILKRNLVGLYGCNMAYRTDQIGDTRFDERLPLYGWQEDVDFASRVPGEKLKTDALNGVHCGVRSGRETSGHLLGYSQVANVAYLLGKGSVPLKFALKLMTRNILSNHLRMMRSEPWIDRRGRARGNRIALVDLIRGRAAPERILDLSVAQKQDVL